ncbi:MAG TPA: cytochrome ubiquinol oxidase subunit I [Ktedonobacterales bacterium]
MDTLTAARAAFAVSLAFHIVFAALGVGLPVLLCLAEGLGLLRRDATWYALARRWGRAAGILFVIGAVSGTTLSFELGILWPRFMAFSTSVIGLPFAIEGFAFFAEAIFIGIYLYGWDRLTPLAHWLCTLPLVISGFLGTWMIVIVNAWMNAPSGFREVNGHAVDVDPLRAMGTLASPAEPIHMMLAALQVSSFTVAAVYAFALVLGRRGAYYRRGLLLPMLVGTIVAPIQAFAGDRVAEMVTDTQPVKLAAMEGLFRTTASAPLHILGYPDVATGQLRFAIEIPWGLSLLARHDPNAVIQGLDAFPRSDWPSYIPVVHWAFDVMVGLGGLMILLPLIFWILYFRRGRTLPMARWLLWTLAALGPLAIVALESGWIVTEGGRQPWVINHVMLVRDGVTSAPGVGFFFFVFLAIYLLLTAVLIWLLIRLWRQTPQVKAEQAKPAPSVNTEPRYPEQQ